jgi:SulP family sulfate permease
MSSFQKIVPAFEWLRNYRRGDLNGDLTAGLIAAIMLIPQGMAYAMLAGLPPVMGLYASTLPLILYALFGSSRHLAVGPVAMISLLVYAGISTLAEPGSYRYLHLVLLLSLMVGILQVILGLLRVGFFVNFISHAVISGFSSAAAIIILISQLHHLLGIHMKSSHFVVHALSEIGSRMGDSHLITLAIGLGSIFIQILFKKTIPRFPGPLFIVAGSAALVYILRLHQIGVKIVGDVPQGLPAFSLPLFSFDSVVVLFPYALTILFVGVMESISIAELIAAKEKYKIDSNQELKGLGLANIVSSFFQGFPVTGGFSRTAATYQAGARTGLALITTALVVILILLFLTPLFYYLPNAVLASIVIVAVFGLIDLKEARRLFKIKKMDGWTLLITFATTLIFGGEQGILIGIGFSLIVFIWRSSHPHTAELGYLEKQGVFRNLKRFPEAKTYPETLILRVDASLYFANMGFLEDLLRKGLTDKPAVKWVIMDLSGVNDIDGVAIDTLEEIIETYKERGIRFLFAGMKGPIRDLVAKAGWKEKYGNQIKYLSIRHALQETTASE